MAEGTLFSGQSKLPNSGKAPQVRFANGVGANGLENGKQGSVIGFGREPEVKERLAALEKIKDGQKG